MTYVYTQSNPVMYTDSTGYKIDWEKVGLTALVVVAVVALSVATAGIGGSIASSAFLGSGFWASVAGGAVGGAISGAIFSAGYSVVSQGIKSGYKNIDIIKVGKDTLLGAAFGATMGGLLAAAGRGMGLLGKTKWAQRQFANWSDDTVNYMFGSKSGSFTFGRFGKVFRLETSIKHGIHYHLPYYSTNQVFWKGIFVFQNQIAGLAGTEISNRFD